MKTQHTPGPWTNDPLQPSIWAEDGQVKVAEVADLPWKNGKSDWMTEQANARLIAAAPALVEALREVQKDISGALAWIQNHDDELWRRDHANTEDALNNAQSIARAALAQAGQEVAS